MQAKLPFTQNRTRVHLMSGQVDNQMLHQLSCERSYWPAFPSAALLLETCCAHSRINIMMRRVKNNKIETPIRRAGEGDVVVPVEKMETERQRERYVRGHERRPSRPVIK